MERRRTTKHSPAILNFRDVGITINTFLGNKIVRPGVLYRSARLDDLTLEDRNQLSEEYPLRTVIDLRSRTEHIAQEQSKHRRPQDNLSSDSQAINVARSAKKTESSHHKIDLNGTGFSWMLVKKLSWYNLAKFLFLIFLGFRLRAISILATNVMQPRGLIGLATDSVDACSCEIREIFSILSQSINYPLVVHCTQGKDRTGLIIMLLLFLLEVPIEAVDYDYMLSERELSFERGKRVDEMRTVGLGEEFAHCAAGLVSSVHKHIEEKYGSTELYLLGCGVSSEAITSIKDILRAERKPDTAST